MATHESDTDTRAAQTVFLLWLLGVDVVGIAELLAEDEASGRAVLKAALVRLLSGKPQYDEAEEDDEAAD